MGRVWNIKRISAQTYTDLLQLTTLLLLNQYINPNNMQLCFQIKVKKNSNNASDIDRDMITVNKFSAHWIKEI